MSLGDSIGNTLVQTYSYQVQIVVWDSAPSNRHHLSERVDYNLESCIYYNPVRRSGQDEKLVFNARQVIF